MDTESSTRLRHAREALELTQDELARSIGLKRVNITNLETGKVKISTLHALALEYVHRVDARWLLNGDGSMWAKTTPLKSAVNFESTGDDKVIREHIEIVRQFEDKVTAKEMNVNLRTIETLDKAEFKDAAGYLRGVANMLQKRNPKGLAVGKKAVNDK